MRRPDTMEKNHPIEKIELSNGETLEIFDRSREISADAWLVAMNFRIKIDLSKKDLKKIKNLTDKQIKEALGNTIVYEVTRERNFIKNPDKDRVFGEIKDSFLSMNLKYLSHPDFAEKYAFKLYNEKKRY